MSFPAIGIGSSVLGFRPYWCPSPFPSLSILGVFHLLLSAIGFQSCFFFTADVSPPIRSIHTYLHTYIHTNLPLYMHSYICAHIRTCIHTYAHTYICTYLHMHMHMKVCIRATRGG